MESEQIRKIAPYRVWFSLTGLCNNRCVWCYRKGSETPQFLETNFVLETAKTLVSCGTKKCTIIGGEPTLHTDYELIVKELTEKDIISCTFVTNGRLLANKIPVGWASNKKVHVVVSLHGADENHYLANAGNKKGFSETVGAIRRLTINQVNHSVNVVLSKENLPYIQKFIETVSDLRANLLCFTIAMPSMDDLSYSTDPFKLANSVGPIHLLCEKFGQRHLFIFSLPWCMLDESLLENLITNRQLIFNCPIGKGRGVVVKENGALSVCTHISNFDLLDKEKKKFFQAQAHSLIFGIPKRWKTYVKLSMFTDTKSVYLADSGSIAKAVAHYGGKFLISKRFSKINGAKSIKKGGMEHEAVGSFFPRAKRQTHSEAAM